MIPDGPILMEWVDEIVCAFSMGCFHSFSGEELKTLVEKLTIELNVQLAKAAEQ